MVSLRKYVWVNTSCICIPCNVHSVIFFSCLCDFRRCLAIVIQAHILSGKAKRNSKLTLSPSCSCSTSPYVNISLAFFAPPHLLHIHAHVHITYSRSREIPRMFFWIFFFFFLFFSFSVTWVRVNWRSLICLSSWDPQLSLAGEAQPLLDQC